MENTSPGPVKVLCRDSPKNWFPPPWSVNSCAIIVHVEPGTGSVNAVRLRVVFVMLIVSGPPVLSVADAPTPLWLHQVNADSAGLL